MALRRVTAVLAFSVAVQGCIACSAAAQTRSTTRQTLQDALDEPFTEVLKSCLAGEQYDKFKRQLTKKFGEQDDHAIPRAIARQHNDVLLHEAIVYKNGLNDLFYTLWREDAQTGFLAVEQQRFDFGRSVESSDDLSLGGNIRTRHLFDCSSVVAAAVNAEVKLPVSVIETALKNSYAFENSSNAGISLLYAKFTSSIPGSLESGTTINPSESFDISLNLWRAYRRILPQGSVIDVSKLWILRSLEGFSVVTVNKFSTGFEANSDMSVTGNIGYLKAHGSVVLNTGMKSDGSTTSQRFIAATPVSEGNFAKAPSVEELVRLIALRGNRLIERDTGFPSQLTDSSGSSITLPYKFRLPQQLCSDELLSAEDGSTVKAYWQTEPAGYCRVVRTLKIDGDTTTKVPRIPTIFQLRLKYAADPKTKSPGDVVFTIDAGQFIENPNASLRAHRVPELTRLAIKDVFFVEGTIGLRIASSPPVALATTPPTFTVMGRCQDKGLMELVEQTSEANRVGTSRVWVLPIKLAISNAEEFQSKGGRCTFDTSVTTVVRQGGNDTIVSFNAETVEYSFAPSPAPPSQAPAATDAN